MLRCQTFQCQCCLTHSSPLSCLSLCFCLHNRTLKSGRWIHTSYGDWIQSNKHLVIVSVTDTVVVMLATTELTEVLLLFFLLFFFLKYLELIFLPSFLVNSKFYLVILLTVYFIFIDLFLFQV